MDYLFPIGWWRETITNDSARTTLEQFPRAKGPIVLLCLAHTELNVISLIVDRGENQGIEFTAGNWHLVLTPLWNNTNIWRCTHILPESILQGAIFFDNVSSIMLVIN